MAIAAAVFCAEFAFIGSFIPAHKEDKDLKKIIYARLTTVSVAVATLSIGSFMISLIIPASKIFTLMCLVHTVAHALFAVGSACRHDDLNNSQNNPAKNNNLY